MKSHKERSSVKRYLLAMFAPALVAFVMQLTWPLFEPSPVAGFLLAIMFCGWYGGLGPGLFSVLVSFLLADYFFVEPFFAVGPQNHSDAIRLGVLLVVGTSCSVLSELMHGERERAEINLDSAHQAEQKYKDIFENAVEGIFQSTPDGHFMTANPALARMLGYDSPEELLSSRTDIARQHYVEPVRRSEFKLQLEEDGVLREFEHRAYRKDGRKIWLSENVRSVCDVNDVVLYYEGFTEDITERKQAEKEKERLLTHEREARLQAVVMRDANLALTRDLSLERVLETLLEYLHKLVPYDSANVMLIEEDSKLVVSAIKGYESFLSDVSIVKANTFDAKSNLLFAQICSTGRSLVIADTKHEPAWQRVTGGEHTRNWIGVPLIAYGKTIGLYSLDKAQPAYFTPEHVRLVESLAAAAASAIQNARLFQQGKEYARELEQRIAERERVEQALRESESFRRTIVESEPECVKLVGADCTLLDMNPAGLAMIGASSREQVIGQSVLSLVAPEWRDRYVEMHERVCQGESVIAEFEMIGLNGVRHWMETHAAPLRNSDFTVCAQLAITRDITERKHAEESLKLFRNLIDQSNDAIEVLDPSTMRFLDCNTTAHQTLGYTREEFLSLTAFDIDPVIDPSMLMALAADMDKSEFVVFESVHRRKDGSTFPVEINAKNIQLERNYRLAVVRDISERKVAEELLRDSEERYRDLVENSRELICTHDLDGLILSANRAAKRALGHDRKDYVGKKNLREILAPEVRGGFEQYLARIKSDGVASGIMLVQTSSGERRLWEYYNTLRTEGVAAPIVRGMARDITERKRAERRTAAFATLAGKLSGARVPLSAAQIIANTAQELFGWDACALKLYDANQDLMHPLLCIDTINGQLADVTPVDADSALTPKARLVVDQGAQLTLRAEPYEFDEDSVPFGDTLRPSASVMSVPIRDSSEVIGILSIQSYKPNVYDQEALSDLQALADHCGAALNRIGSEEALRKQKEILQNIFDHIPAMICFFDADGRIKLINREWECWRGWALEEILSQNIDLVAQGYPDPEYRQEVLALAANANGKPFNIKTKVRDGRVLDTTWSISTLSDGTRIGLGQDITERKQAEDALRESEERYRELFENAKDATYVHDLTGRYTSVNRAAEKLSGRSREEIIGRRFTDFVPPEQVEVVNEHLCQQLAEEGESIYEIEVIARDGRRVPVEVSSHIIYQDGVRVGVQGTARDITERRRDEQALRNYSRQLIEAQETERQTIARELHDQIGQVLTAIQLNLQSVWETCESSEARALIDEGITIVDEAIGQVRDLSFELRPSLLDDLGLMTALRWYVDRFAQRTGIRATTVISLPQRPMRLRQEFETACFRIVQEALTNVVRHAKARKVSITLKGSADEIVLTVKDDGIGLDANAHNLAAFPIRVGLRGMKERTLALGGRLEVSSSPSRGTAIRAYFPSQSVAN